MTKSLPIEESQELFLLDSSVVSGGGYSITSELHKGFEGVVSLDPERQNQDVLRVGNLIRLAMSQELAVISEVVAEQTEFLRILNEQRSFLDKSLMKPKLKGRKSERNDFDLNSHKAHLKEIKSYSNLLHSSVRLNSGLDPRDSFTNTQQEVYNRFLAVTNDISSYLRVNEFVRVKRDYKLGDKLQTDMKVIATAFTLSYDRPVTILTRDKDIGKISDRITLEMPFDEFRRKYNLPLSQTHQVDFRDLSFN